ncbi:hypothetical protein [Nesterenkonia populi]
MQLRDHVVPTTDQLVELYDAVGWSIYTEDPNRLLRDVETASLRSFVRFD